MHLPSHQTINQRQGSNSQSHRSTSIASFRIKNDSTLTSNREDAHSPCPKFHSSTKREEKKSIRRNRLLRREGRNPSRGEADRGEKRAHLRDRRGGAEGEGSITDCFSRLGFRRGIGAAGFWLGTKSGGGKRAPPHTLALRRNVTLT